MAIQIKNLKRVFTRTIDLSELKPEIADHLTDGVDLVVDEIMEMLKELDINLKISTEPNLEKPGFQLILEHNSLSEEERRD